MAAQARRVNLDELGEFACKLIREVRDSGDELVLIDGAEEVRLARSVAETPPPATDAEHDEDLRERREAWARIVARRTEITKGWTSPLSAAEVVDEQRR